MAVDFAAFSGLSNVGFKMKNNEDYILINQDDFGGEYLFASVADGSGSKESMFRPASIVSNEVEEMLKRFYKKDPDLFRTHSRLLLEEAFLSANNTLIGFKLGNEEERYGFASTLTAALISRDGTLTFAHVGNTRLYLIRDTKTLQLTKDHTEGQKLVDKGALSEEGYYTAIERLSLTNGLGVSPSPTVQTVKIPLKNNDVIIMTSDGIHYSYRKEAFFDILMNTQTMDDAAHEMIKTALDLKNYPDNASVNVIWFFGPDAGTDRSQEQRSSSPEEEEGDDV